MIVDIEFFDEEPLENIITCMNYMADKVIFFGNCDMTHEKRQCMERFLKDSCGVQEVDYHVIQPETTEDALAVLRRVIDCELEQKNEVYFDITGGEDVILVAFGILASEYELPMHKFDVVHNRLIEMNRDAERCLSKNVPANHVSLDLEQMIKLQGGVINESLHKELKKTDGGISEDEILSIWKVAKNNWGIWNAFSAFLRETIDGDALYELETVASRFGGKYAKKKLVIVNPLSETCLKRAKEMGIEVVQLES